MLTITVTALNAQSLPQPLSANFGETWGTIGRASDNTLVLTDPDRKISRTHANVYFRDGAWGLRDQGSVVPVLLNGHPLGNGCESPLVAGDEIRISAYTMRVTGATAPAVVTPAPPALAPIPETPAVVAPAPSALAAETPAVVAPAPSALAAMPETPAGGMAAPGPAPEEAMPVPVVSWSGDAPEIAGEGITTIILSTPELPSALAPADAGTRAPAAPTPTPTPPEPPASPVSTVARAVTDDELLRALVAGLGLRDVEIPGGLTPQLMRQLGQLLHEATHGLIDLLAARTLVKREVRADMTVIVSRDNNPLKFSPNVETALAQLLVPKGRGFMPPLRAVGDAYDDLRTHQEGFMAGMRSALAMILARFDPHELEARLSDTSMVGSLLPTTRKAKLWDMFGHLYGDISKEAESDFHSLFGQEFLRAYQAHAGKGPKQTDSAPKP